MRKTPHTPPTTRSRFWARSILGYLTAVPLAFASMVFIPASANAVDFCRTGDADYNNGYEIINNSKQTLELESATQWENAERTHQRTECSWGERAPQAIAPGETGVFSVGMFPHMQPMGRWRDRTDVVYTVKDHPEQTVALDANIEYLVDDWVFGRTFVLQIDHSDCSASDDALVTCEPTPNTEGRGYQTVYTITDRSTDPSGE